VFQPIAVVPRAGFETAITLHPSGSYLGIVALDANGNKLGAARTIKL